MTSLPLITLNLLSNLHLCMFLTVPDKELAAWYYMMRTRYGRFEGKSGDGRKELTEREAWIKRAFSFLGRHIRRVPSRQACSVSIFQENYSLI